MCAMKICLRIWKNSGKTKISNLTLFSPHCIHAISIVELIEGTEIHDKAVEPGVWSKTINCIDFMRLCSITNSSIWKQFKALLSCNNTHGIVHARDGWRTDASCVDSIVKRRFNCETKFQCNWLKLNAHCTLCIKCCAYNYPMSINISYGST